MNTAPHVAPVPTRPPRIPRLPDTMRQDTPGYEDDARTLDLLRGAMRVGELASEPAHYQAGYVDGHRAGRWHAGFVGFLIGMAFVAGSVQLGYWVGGMP